MAIDPVATAISLIAVGISIWAVRSQNALQARLLNLETARERDRVAEAKRAQLRARVLQDTLPNNVRIYYLVIANQGAAEARNVDVLVDGKPLLENERMLVEDHHVVKMLGPGSTVRYILLAEFGGPAVLDVALSWEDDTGEPGHWRSQLSWI